MRFSSLITFVAAAIAVVAQPGKQSRPLNPPLSSLRTVDWDALAPAPIAAVTNAKRFAQGLPPLSPRRRNPNRGVHHGAVHARQGTRVVSAPRSETSPVARAEKKCNILVKNSSTGQELGYIAKEWNRYAEYGPLQNGQDGDALEVSFSASPDTRTDRIDLLATNGKSAAHPFVGAAVGFGSDDESIGAGSPNYLLLAGTTQTPSESTPSFEADNSFSEVTGAETASESAIWSYDPNSLALTIQWTNPDGSLVDADILLSNREDNVDLFTLTGDADVFRSTYGIEAPEVTFSCVPPIVVA